MLKILGTIGKGWGTYVGLAGVLAGTFLGTDVAHTVVDVGQTIPTVVLSIGALLGAAGFGRKTGYAVFQHND